MTMTTKPPRKDRSDRDNRDGEGSSVSAGLVISVLVVVLVLIGGVFVIWHNHHNNNDTGAPAAQHPSTSAPSGTGSGGPTGFGVPAVDVFGRRVDVPNNPAGQPLPQTGHPRSPSDPDWLTAAPAGTQGPGGWQRVHGASVPFSTSDGPTAIVDGVPTGYAHTPQGCALAAQYVMWETGAQPGNWTLRLRMVEGTTEHGPDRQTFDRLKAEGKAPDQQPDWVTQYMVASDAYRIHSWQPDLCTVDLAMRADPDPSGVARWMYSEVAMVWDHNSWMNRLPPNNMLPQDYVTTLQGWTPW